MTVLKLHHFVGLLLIVWLARNCANASCNKPGGGTIEAGDHDIVNCKTIYRCTKHGDEYQLSTYPACAKRKCSNPIHVRDADLSKPWPECCAHYKC